MDQRREAIESHAGGRQNFRQMAKALVAADHVDEGTFREARSVTERPENLQPQVTGASRPRIVQEPNRLPRRR